MRCLSFKNQKHKNKIKDKRKKREKFNSDEIFGRKRLKITIIKIIAILKKLI